MWWVKTESGWLLCVCHLHLSVIRALSPLSLWMPRSWPESDFSFVGSGPSGNRVLCLQRELGRGLESEMRIHLCLDSELGRAHYLPHKFAHNVDFPLKCFLHAGTERQHQLIKHSTLSDHPWHATDAQKITRADRDQHLYRSLRLDSV